MLFLQNKWEYLAGVIDTEGYPKFRENYRLEMNKLNRRGRLNAISVTE